MLLGARSTDVGRKSSGFTRPSKDTADVAKRGTSKRGRGRGTSSMKQTTLSFSQSRLFILTCIVFWTLCSVVMQPCAIGIAMSSLISGFSKARMLFFWWGVGGGTNFNANLLINICRSATVIRSEDVASSEEEADANEVVENSVCLFPQNFIVY